jgi:predicted alpha/beta hydrolase
VTDTSRALEVPVTAADGHRTILQARVPDLPRATLLWLPGMGIAARHFLAFAEALSGRGFAVFVHDWRGIGSSSLRAGRHSDWGYREVLTFDLPACEAAIANVLPGLPRIVGGHSLGGQLASCRLALAPDSASQLWLVASGVPYWRTFPLRNAWWLPTAYQAMRSLAILCGKLPGRRLGFGGEEARSLIRDWTASGLTGRYAAAGLDVDLESALARVDVPIHAVNMGRDWLAPESSLRALLAKMPRAAARVVVLEEAAPEVQADHYAWMRQPLATVGALLG